MVRNSQNRNSEAKGNHIMASRTTRNQMSYGSTQSNGPRTNVQNTAEVRQKIITLWRRFDSGELKPQEARTHIGFARTILDTLKVEIAAAHLAQAHVPDSVPLLPKNKNALSFRGNGHE
jgi:hypothetical protein